MLSNVVLWCLNSVNIKYSVSEFFFSDFAVVKHFYDLRVCSDNERDHICSVAAIARGRFWRTDTDYSRSRTESSWSQCLILWFASLLSYNVWFPQYFNKYLAASFASSYVTTLILSLEPSVLILGHVHIVFCHYSVNQQYFLLRITISDTHTVSGFFKVMTVTVC